MGVDAPLAHLRRRAQSTGGAAVRVGRDPCVVVPVVEDVVRVVDVDAIWQTRSFNSAEQQQLAAAAGSVGERRPRVRSVVVAQCVLCGEPAGERTVDSGRACIGRVRVRLSLVGTASLVSGGSIIWGEPLVRRHTLESNSMCAEPWSCERQ